MKRRLLQRLLLAKQEKRPVALVTDTRDGRQLLLDGQAVEGELPASPALLESARQRLREDRSGLLDDGEHFVQVFLPPLRLAIVGAVHISQALVPMASLAGYAVTVIDPRRAWATPERFPGVEMITEWPDDALEAFRPDERTAIVTLTHDPKIDDPALIHALRSPAFYIGALGSTRTHAKRVERLRAEGLGESDLTRIHGPAGLAIGARSPAEIALAILAEMTAALRKAPPLVKAERAA